MGLLVQKYGGSSLASAQHIRAIARRVAGLHQQGHQIILVVSAMGHTTNDLLRQAQEISATPNRRELDMLLSTGERVAMSLMSMALLDLGVPSLSLTGSQAGILTDGSHSNARILDLKPVRVAEALGQGSVVVLAGFQGVHPQTREITTLGRGGTDTTAVAMAAHFRAVSCEILKDVAGIFSGDPKYVDSPRHLPHLNYNHLLEMTFWGAKVLHYRSVELAQRLRVPLIVKLAHGEGSSTKINEEKSMFEAPQVLSVTSHAQLLRVRAHGEGWHQSWERMNQFFSEHKLPWPQVINCRKEIDGCIFLLAAAAELLLTIQTLSNRTSGQIEFIDSLGSVSLVCAGGAGPELLAEVSKSLARKNIFPQETATSSLTTTVFIDPSDREAALRLLHQKFLPI